MGPPASGAARMIPNVDHNQNLAMGIQNSNNNNGRSGLGERLSSTDVNAIQNSMMGATNMSGFGGAGGNTFANAGLSMMNGNSNNPIGNAGNNSTFGNAGAQAILGLNSGSGAHMLVNE